MALDVGRAEQLASVVAETEARAEARQPKVHASALAETSAGAEAGARRAEQLASAVVGTAAGAETRQSRACTSAVAKAVPAAAATAQAEAVAEARHAKQLEIVPAGRSAARPVTTLEVGEPPPGALVVTGHATEPPAMDGRRLREQAQALGAAHAAVVAQLEQRRAVDLEKRLAKKEHVAARKSEALKRVAALEAGAGRARAIHTQAPGTVQRGGDTTDRRLVCFGRPSRFVGSRETTMQGPGASSAAPLYSRACSVAPAPWRSRQPSAAVTRPRLQLAYFLGTAAGRLGATAASARFSHAGVLAASALPTFLAGAAS